MTQAPSSPMSPTGQVPYGVATSRLKRTFFDMVRTLFSFTAVGFPVISLALIVVAVSAGGFSTDRSWRQEQWYEVNPWLGHCNCENILQSPCSERADAFGGTAWLSTAALITTGLMCMLQLWELSAYGMYGASHTYSRLIIIGCLVALGSLIFSLTAFHAVLIEEHCGLPSMQADSYEFYVAPGLQILCAVLMTAYTIHSGMAFRRPVRGPPSLSVANLSVLMALMGVTTTSRIWMFKQPSSDYPKYFAGVWSICYCMDCDAVKSEGMIAGILGVVAIVFQLLAVYFGTMRAVDYKGTTTIHTSIFLFLATGSLGGCLGLTYVFNDKISQCPVVSVTTPTVVELSSANFSFAWGVYVLAVGGALNVISLVTNFVYRCPTCNCCGYEGLSEDDGILYRAMWFSQLKDPRVVEYERGGEAEAEMEEEDAAEDAKEKEELAKAEQEARDDAAAAEV